MKINGIDYTIDELCAALGQFDSIDELQCYLQMISREPTEEEYQEFAAIVLSKYPELL